MTSTFEPPPRPGQKAAPAEPPTPAIPSGKGGQTPWNSTRSARDWLDSPSQPKAESPTDLAAHTQAEQAVEPAAKKQFKMPQLPKLPQMPQFKLPQLPKLTGDKPQAAMPEPPKRPSRANQFTVEEAVPTPPPNERQAAPKSNKTRKRRAAANKKKQPKIIMATISGLICAAIVLLAECGLWGFYCFSHNVPGDTNVNASTFMYCLAVFVGNFWAGAVVRRRSLKPSAIICAVFLVLSMVISLNLFSWREIKIKMFLLKIVLTLAAAALGFILSLGPYLINKSIKRKRQEQAQLRQRQLERRQMQQQQREFESELAKHNRRRF